MSGLVPWRALPVRRAASTPAVRSPKSPARRGPDGVQRAPLSAASAPATARGPLGFVVALIDTQRDIGRQKRARRTQQAEMLRAEYERQARMSLPSPKPLQLNP